MFRVIALVLLLALSACASRQASTLTAKIACKEFNEKVAGGNIAGAATYACTFSQYFYGEERERFMSCVREKGSILSRSSEELLRSIAMVSSRSDAITVASDIGKYKKCDWGDGSVDQGVEKVLSEKVNKDLADKRYAMFFSDSDVFPELKNEPQVKYIFDSEVQTLSSGVDNVVFEDMMAFLKKNENAKNYMADAKRLISKLSFNPRMLENEDFKSVFPDIYNEKYKASAVEIVVESDNRIVKEDVSNMLSKMSKLISVVKETKNPNAYRVVVKLVTYIEKTPPPTRETLMFSGADIDLAVAVLALPRNASMMVDVATFGVGLDYAFELIIYKGKDEIKNVLVRDSLMQTCHACTSVRVQNVFGGVSNAPCFPNQRVQAFCKSGCSTPPNIQSLKSQAFSKLMLEIKNIDGLQSL